MNLKNYIISRLKLIEKQLDTLIQEKKSPHNELFRAARHSLQGPAKRLRPLLALATLETLGGEPEKALTAVCSLELVHTYSLIHDDLPCMDDDDFRRGKPSLHRAFPEGHAVLTGDYLLTYAFEILAADKNLSSKQRLQLIQLLAKNAGSEGMIGGQVMDLESEAKEIDLEKLRLIHLSKTGALITASIEFGGIIANASKTHLKLLRSFGNHIGIAFQIIDDILDVTASVQKHGRQQSSDVTNQKTTYVSLLGLEASRALAQNHYEAALAMLKKLPYPIPLLVDLAAFIIHRKN